MPEYTCPKCSIRLDVNYQPHYFVGGNEVDEQEWNVAKKREEKENKRLHKRQNGQRCRVPGLFGDQHDFGRETDPATGLDGRYMPQLARFHGDPKAVVRHVNDVVEIAKHRNLGVERW